MRDTNQPNAQWAFNEAIKEGRLSRDQGDLLYAGDFMFMGRHDGIDEFKHRDTRRYLMPKWEPRRAVLI